MIETIPLLKLAFLAFRQISRPIANYVKERAKSSPRFKKHIFIPSAQGNYMEISIGN